MPILLILFNELMKENVHSYKNIYIYIYIYIYILTLCKKFFND